MDVPVDWSGVVDSAQPWIPRSRLPAWTSQKFIAWRCDSVLHGLARGHIVDIQLPMLGQTPSDRTIVSTMEFGTLRPVWYGDYACWKVQGPAPTPRTGMCRILCERDVGYNIRAAEICSGAMGAWNLALRHFPRWTSQWAIDSDAAACENFAKNHGARIVMEPEEVPVDGSQEHLLLLHDLRVFRWLHITNCRDSDVWMISHPCQPWSAMGFGGGGSATVDGQILLTILQCIRMCQPAYVMFENVPGFRRHAEFEAFLQTLQACGYVRYSSLTHDMGQCTHMSRKRWLGVFINTLHIDGWKPLNLHMATHAAVETVFRPAEHCLHTKGHDSGGRVCHHE